MTIVPARCISKIKEIMHRDGHGMFYYLLHSSENKNEQTAGSLSKVEVEKKVPDQLLVFRIGDP